MAQLKKPRNWVIIAGMLLIAAMVSAELIPNTSRGLGPLQLSGIVVGVGLLLISRVRGSYLGIIGVTVVSTLMTVVLLELAIGVLGYEADYTAELITQSQQPLERAPYSVCDLNHGCRFVGDAMPESLCPGTNPEKTSHFCIINSQGYHDTDEFVLSSQLEQAETRIMLLGDSFTFGMAADYPLGFADLISEHVGLEHDGMVWNFGIPGTSTRQALLLAQEYVPVMQPDIVVLGFFNNDFNENLYPVDLYENPLIEGKYQLVNAYQLSNTLEPQRLTDANIYFRAHGQPASNTQLEILLRRTRLGSLLLNALPSLVRIANPDATWSASVQQTQDLLQQLQTYLAAENIPLVVLYIPSLDDIQSPTQTYITFQQISAELGLHRLDMLESLVVDDYWALPNGHWTNSGHAKAGEVLIACLDFMLENSGAICPEAAN
jgi:hypothetical protein